MDGERKITISRDLILRFEEFSLHNIQSLNDFRSDDYVWEGVDGKRALWWTAQETLQGTFHGDKKTRDDIDAPDWITNSIRNLSSSGLGIIQNRR